MASAPGGASNHQKGAAQLPEPLPNPTMNSTETRKDTGILLQQYLSRTVDQYGTERRVVDGYHLAVPSTSQGSRGHRSMLKPAHNQASANPCDTAPCRAPRTRVLSQRRDSPGNRTLPVRPWPSDLECLPCDSMSPAKKVLAPGAVFCFHGPRISGGAG
jgi:hypothetical protein